jgi:hypothetical protein
LALVIKGTYHANADSSYFPCKLIINLTLLHVIPSRLNLFLPSLLWLEAYYKGAGITKKIIPADNLFLNKD